MYINKSKHKGGGEWPPTPLDDLGGAQLPLPLAQPLSTTPHPPLLLIKLKFFILFSKISGDLYPIYLNIFCIDRIIYIRTLGTYISVNFTKQWFRQSELKGKGNIHYFPFSKPYKDIYFIIKQFYKLV